MPNRTRSHVFAALAIALAAAPALTVPSPALAQAKPAITDETQLPRFSYKIALKPSELIVASDAVFAPFAAQVGADIDSTLSSYTIEDKSTLAQFAATKAALQMLANDYSAARKSIDLLRGYQTKPELALLTDRTYLAYIDAARVSTGDVAAFDKRYAAALHAQTDALPWAVVGDTIKETYASDRTATQALSVGGVANAVDPAYEKSGTVDAPTAARLIATRARLKFALPFAGIDATVLKGYIARNNVLKPDIWAARDVTIDAGQVKGTVNVGIWDSGVDPADYPDRMYVDTDGHNGLSFDDTTKASTSDLFPLPPAVASDYERDVTIESGRSDLQQGLDTPDASVAAKFLRSLGVAQARAFDHELDVLDEYEHGSHVAGIASRGNAAARIVVARFDDNFSSLVLDQDPETWISAMASDLEAQGAYFRSHGVRVVNMSWGDEVAEFEGWLALVDPNGDPAARKARAQKLYGIWRDAVSNVISKSPDILFVSAAGNSDSDASFAGDVPSSFTNPNLLVVGAVNQAGDATNFTSYGPTVAVFADGFQVPSKIPGNHVAKFSGTSMASPNVANLAAKLFALDPTLTALKVRDLIVRGATPSADGKRMLIDPKASVALMHA